MIVLVLKSAHQLLCYGLGSFCTTITNVNLHHLQLVLGCLQLAIMQDVKIILKMESTCVMSNPTTIMVFYIFQQAHHVLLQRIIFIWIFLLLPQLDEFPFVSNSHYLHCFTLDIMYPSNVLIPLELHGAFQCFKCHFHLLLPFLA